MTEPHTAMGQVELDRLTKQVGRAMVAVAGPRWQRLRAEYRSVGRHVEVDLTVTGADGEPVSVRPPTEMVEGLRTLRGGMYRAGRGTWISAVYEIEPPGDYTVEFEPDIEPTWRRVPPPIGFIDELRFFPREDSHIPGWLRARITRPGEAAPGHRPPGGPIPAPHHPGSTPQPGPTSGPRPGPPQPGPPPGPAQPSHAPPPSPGRSGHTPSGPGQPGPGQSGPGQPDPGQPGRHHGSGPIPAPPRGPVPPFPPTPPGGVPNPASGPPTPPWGIPGGPVPPPGWTPPSR
ncbi:hypothetical protein ACTG9Q_16920 [Actinokineospora sp. 24-640]